MERPIFPHIRVKLVGRDGNAYFILGAMSRAMKQAKVPEAQRKEFMAEATAGDYNHLLATCCKWVEVL